MVYDVGRKSLYRIVASAWSGIIGGCDIRNWDLVEAGLKMLEMAEMKLFWHLINKSHWEEIVNSLHGARPLPSQAFLQGSCLRLVTAK